MIELSRYFLCLQPHSLSDEATINCLQYGHSVADDETKDGNATESLIYALHDQSCIDIALNVHLHKHLFDNQHNLGCKAIYPVPFLVHIFVHLMHILF